MFRKFRCQKQILITCGAKIYAKDPNIAPPKRKPATKSLPPPLLPSLHISEGTTKDENRKEISTIAAETKST